MKKYLYALCLLVFSLTTSAYRIVNDTSYDLWVSTLICDDTIWAQHDFWVNKHSTMEHPMPNPENSMLYIDITNFFFTWKGNHFPANSTLYIVELDESKFNVNN